MERQRSEIVLAVMEAGGPEARFDPVRMQKLLFLVEREIPHLIDGPYFNFEPYNYGPFDKAVYDELDKLTSQDQVSIDGRRRYRRYALTDTGHEKGDRVLNELPVQASSYMKDVARWILTVPFQQLLSAVYRQYPEMAVNSIVPHLASRYPHASLYFPESSFLSGMARTLDFMGTLDAYQTSTNERIDALATDSDWRAVGDDIRAAMSFVFQEARRESQA